MDMQQIRSRLLRVILVIPLFSLLFGITPQGASAQGRSGAVYVLTNQSSGNSVMVYRRAPDGSLSFSGSFLTGGAGTGTGADPLGSQGALVLTCDHRLLFAVNAGSNEISVFAVRGQHLHLLDKVASGGQMPVSIAVHGRLVYVLNAGGSPNVAGYTLDPFTNHLSALPGSQRQLPGGAGAGPAEASFSLDGSILMVTEKNTSKIDTYVVRDDGLLSNPTVTASSGATPFGFAFTYGSFAIVSEAGPGALSSYEVDDNGSVELVTGSLSDGQKAGCWVVVTGDGRFAYLANSASNSIGSYTVSRDGVLNLLDPTAGLPGSGSVPIDMALSAGSRFLYARDGGNGTVSGFRVEPDGSLTPVGSVSGVPTGAQGLAAR